MGKSLSFMLALALLTMSTPGVAQGQDDSQVAVYLDGDEIDGAEATYLLDDTTYVPIRQVCEAMGATVIWDGEDKSVTVEAPDLVIRARAGDKYLEANGRYFYIEEGCHFTDGSFMVPARTLAQAFGANVEWVNTAGGIVITSGEEPLVSGDEYYNDDDVYWLSRIIRAEAGNQSLEGKIAVGNVVMNRVNDPSFPDNVKDVIFDRRSGIQFSPAYSGSIYKDPTEDCIIAAKLALEGTDIAGGSLYFIPAWAAESSWAGRNREVYEQIGDHVFFL